MDAILPPRAGSRVTWQAPAVMTTFSTALAKLFSRYLTSATSCDFIVWKILREILLRIYCRTIPPSSVEFRLSANRQRKSAAPRSHPATIHAPASSAQIANRLPSHYNCRATHQTSLRAIVLAPSGDLWLRSDQRRAAREPSYPPENRPSPARQQYPVAVCLRMVQSGCPSAAGDRGPEPRGVLRPDPGQTRHPRLAATASAWPITLLPRLRRGNTPG